LQAGRRFNMDQEEEDEAKITERIMDVVRGESRRRKTAGQDATWIPNRSAPFPALTLHSTSP
jgi:hypothetical protein